MKLKSFLKFYGISNKQFSKNLGISNVSLSRYISGDRLPNSKILNRIYLLTDGLVDANPDDDFGFSETWETFGDAKSYSPTRQEDI